MDQIQGLYPDSKEEVIFATALDSLKVEYVYQLPVQGGRTRRGGSVVDFYVSDTAPNPVAVQIEGSYWHPQGSQEEDFQRQQLERWLRFRGARLVTIRIDDGALASVESAMRFIREEIL